MFFIFGNTVVQFILVVIFFCTVAVCSCMAIEKLVGCFFPIGEDELQRIMNAHPKPPGTETAQAPAPVAVPPVLPHVVIQIDPPESDEEFNELDQQETPILGNPSSDDEETTSL